MASVVSPRRRPRRPPLEHALAAARRNDPAAVSEVLARCEPVVRHATAGLFAPGHEREDVLQVARLAVFHAIRQWDPAGGLQFVAFARLCARREAMTFITGARRGKHAVLDGAVRLHHRARRDEPYALDDVLQASRATDPAARTLARERLGEILGRLGTLSDYERASLTMMLNGRSRASSAAALGVSEKSVDNALQRVRRKIAA